MSWLGLDHFVAVRAALAARTVAAKMETAGRSTRGPASDSASMVRGMEPTSAPAVFHLIYEDCDGEESERTVTVQHVDGVHGELMLTCYCHLRHAARTFRCDRIIEVYDATTGEVHSDAAAFFAANPMLGSSADPLSRALRTCRDELTILTVIGAADGVFDADEQDRVLIHLYDRCPDDPLEESAARQQLATLAPDESSFMAAVGRLKRLDVRARQIFRSSLRKVVDCDGECDPAELAFVSEIDDRLGPRP